MSNDPGIIYAVKNAAWPTWIKVGRAEGIKQEADFLMRRRLYAYNTGDPMRGFEVVTYAYAHCCRTAERYAHDFLEAFSYRGNGEWFQQQEEYVKRYVEEAAQIARLHPALRPPRYKETLAEARGLDAEATAIIAVTEDLPRQRDPRVVETAQAAHAVIQDLMETMAMPDPRLEAAATAVLRRLSALKEQS